MGLSPHVRGSRGARFADESPVGSIPACAGKPISTWRRATISRVYPRMCGEAFLIAAAISFVCGLSPHVRGSPNQDGAGVKVLRSIPACAGKPELILRSAIVMRVYPRMCGEAGVFLKTTLGKSGLSPHVRGSHPPRGGSLRTTRSIPACAGKPQGDDGATSQGKVYPRMCGEAQSREFTSESQAGLSPHVRGSRNPKMRRAMPVGSIPACAGKPTSMSAFSCPCWVYPRMCGEALVRMFSYLLTWGLSPHVRGSLCALGGGGVSSGSIPACAGKPLRSALAVYCSWVYPRMCGEAEQWMPEADGMTGLSPHVRGSRVDESVRRRVVGSIPACAGKPPTRTRAAASRRVYPRMCGEATLSVYSVPIALGLSPHVRGSQVCHLVSSPKVGSIPACAGKPTAALRLAMPDGVYPRMCGEAETRSPKANFSAGLSPHVRGSPSSVTTASIICGSIPACAGKPLM